MLRRLLKIFGIVVGILAVVVVALFVYVRAVSVIDPPQPRSLDVLSAEIEEPDSGLYRIGNNWFRKSESGLYELYVEGEPFERGVINGKLTRDLVQYQEKVFNDQIESIVPSDFYRYLLRHLIGYFNRDLDKHVEDEFKLEIYGVSHAASHDYDHIASPYQRMLNYHAAHDIGHALQNMSLVGCTAFATWGEYSADGSLIIGRNFDFYVGEAFARDKIVAFYNPAEGNKFMMVTFGGMTGVLSGMNEKGLTVTINAAKSEIPDKAATPVSLVAREILQYAGNIDEAYAIAARREMFVAESFLIGSAADGKAAIIEKTPAETTLVDSYNGVVVCTNHFQSETLGQTNLNQEHVRTSASLYRMKRVEELIAGSGANTIDKTAHILRDQRGQGGEDIGLGNEKLINQLVAHHGIIFQPEKRLVWVATAPYQLGKFVCYDLNKVFSLEMSENHEVYDSDKLIEADTFLTTEAFARYEKFSTYRFPFQPHSNLDPDSIVAWNPRSYHAHMLAGDYLIEVGEYARAATILEKGLSLEVATLQEREHMEKQLAYCREKLK